MANTLLIYLSAARTLSETMFRTSRLITQPYADLSDAWDAIATSNLEAMAKTFKQAMREARELWRSDDLESPLHPSVVRRTMEAAREGDLANLKKLVAKMERSLERHELMEIVQACPEAITFIPPFIVDPADFED